MNHFAEVFIRRPVATTLLTLGLALAGVFAFPLLPVAPLPQVDFPTISVSASLPGASPETMASTVATPLERRLGRIAGVTEMTSSSSLGSTRITLQFDLDRDIDGAAARRAGGHQRRPRADLPTGLPPQPDLPQGQPGRCADHDPVADLGHPDARARCTMPPPRARAEDCRRSRASARSRIGGSSLPAVRVELNPTALNQLRHRPGGRAQRTLGARQRQPAEGGGGGRRPGTGRSTPTTRRKRPPTSAR